MPILTSQEQKWVDTRLTQIQTEQTSYAALYSKYQKQSKITYGNITVEIVELVAPNQETGYIVILYKIVNSVPYSCSYGFGRDATTNTRSWSDMTIPAERL